MSWIDTHCHLDAREFDADRAAVVARARAAGVTQLVLPAVARSNFDVVRALAHEHAKVGYRSDMSHCIVVAKLVLATEITEV